MAVGRVLEGHVTCSSAAQARMSGDQHACRNTRTSFLGRAKTISLGRDPASGCDNWDRLASKCTPSGQKNPATAARKWPNVSHGTHPRAIPCDTSTIFALARQKSNKLPPTEYCRRLKKTIILTRKNAIRIALPVTSVRSVRYVSHFRQNTHRDQGRYQAIFGEPYGTKRKTGNGEAFWFI